MCSEEARYTLVIQEKLHSTKLEIYLFIKFNALFLCIIQHFLPAVCVCVCVYVCVCV